MKVMLISPLPRLAQKPGPRLLPLGLAYMAAILRREGHTVSIFDRFAAAASLGPDQEQIDARMLQRLHLFQPDLIGLNTISPLIDDTAVCAALIRQQFLGPLLAGGHHATALPELTLEKIPQLNGVVQGEGELALLSLAGGADPSRVPGFWWKNGETISGSAPEQISDLDKLPFPALDLLDMRFYTRPGKNAIRGHYLSAVALITSRGCTRRCSFCTESLTYGQGVRRHSPEYVVEMIRDVLMKYPLEGIYFHDNDFLFDRERAVMICEKMIAAGLHRRIKFAIQTRVNRISLAMLRLLKKAGCTLVEIGFETASQAELDSVRKGTTVAQNSRALELCRRAGLEVHAYMLSGFAGETVADLEARLHWLKRGPPHLTFSMSMLQLYPGTDLYREKGNSFFENGVWTGEKVRAYYQTDHLSAVPAAERRAWMKRRFFPYQRRRDRAAVLRRNPPLKVIRIIVEKAVHIWSRRGNLFRILAE